MEQEQLLENIKAILIEQGDLLQILREINSYDGYFDGDDWWENDEEFFETYYEGDVMGAVRAVCFGDYHFMDEYVKINAYGNLETTNYVQGEIESIIDDVVEHLIEIWDEIGSSVDLPNDARTMIEQYIAMDNDEEDYEEEDYDEDGEDFGDE